MYNRYQGNSGRVIRVRDGPDPHAARDSTPEKAAPAASPGRGTPYRERPGQRRLLPGLSLPNVLPKGVSELETEDLILLLILYLMYRESGDTELLMIMGAMFLI